MKITADLYGYVEIEVDDEVASRVLETIRDVEDFVYKIALLRLELSSMDGYADLEDTQASVTYESDWCIDWQSDQPPIKKSHEDIE